MRDIFDLDSYNFELPAENIAQTPAEPRDNSNLLVWNISENQAPNFNNKFHDITKYFRPDDLLILNDTKVIPARLICNRSGGGKSEVFLLKPLDNYSKWEALVKPARKIHAGDVLTIGYHKINILSEHDAGIREISFDNNFSGAEFFNFLDEIGHVPLPPYIKPDDNLKASYQTVFAKNNGSVAAPTASLHFTNELLNKITALGVKIAYVTLHVGLGTFRPVQSQDIRSHDIHEEYCEIPEGTAELINAYKSQHKRIIASGTTAARTLESFSSIDRKILCGSKNTRLFIYPGYEFKIIDGLITNFHLPKSSLIMLVSEPSSTKMISLSEGSNESARMLSIQSDSIS